MSRIQYRDMGELSPSERAGQMWLNTDDVLAIIPLDRKTFWKQVKEGVFPAPYRWKKAAYWSQADIKAYIDGRVAGTPQPVSTKTPITWSAVADLLKQKYRGMTNKQIAHYLNADESDTANLTRLMAKAGTLKLFKPIRDGAGAPNFYTFNTETIEA